MRLKLGHITTTTLHPRPGSLWPWRQCHAEPRPPYTEHGVLAESDTSVRNNAFMCKLQCANYLHIAHIRASVYYDGGWLARLPAGTLNYPPSSHHST